MARDLDDGLPGADLIRTALEDLSAGRATVEALLVLEARSRLQALGYEVPRLAIASPRERMYELIERQVGPQRAHARYNALRRRLLSFIHSARFSSAAR
jgi:hypothetical protein